MREIIDILDASGKALEIESPSVKPLREVINVLKEIDCSKTGNYLIVFFLESYINDVLFNVVGYVKWIDGVTEPIQCKLLNGIGKEFDNMSSTLSSGKSQSEQNLALMDSYENLSKIYMNAITRFNLVYADNSSSFKKNKDAGVR